MKKILKRLTPHSWRYAFRLFQLNRKRKGVSLAEALSKSARQIGILDYAPKRIFFEVTAHEEIDHLKSCQREPETVAWIEEFIRPGDVFYDVGANIGVFSLIAHERLRGQGMIYGFEPSFSTFAAFSKNIFLNAASRTVCPLPVALADKTAMMFFKYAKIASGQAFHELGETRDADGRTKSAYVQPVMSFTLDDLISIFSLEQPTHIKIDVDGEEAKVLAGAKATLRSPSLRSILIEIDENLDGGQHISSLITGSGFSLHLKHPKGKSGMYNCIFTKP